MVINNSIFWAQPNINSTSENALQTINVSSGYSHEQKAEIIAITEAHYKSAAEANRKALGVYGKIDIKDPDTQNAARGLISAKYKNNTNLTPAQKKAAIQNEFNMTLFGHNKYPDGNDALFTGTSLGTHEFGGSKKNVEYAEKQMNNQLNSLFTKNNISVPPNIKLLFSIDPKDFKVNVSGTNDDDLIKSIEKLLNHEENGKAIFDYIMKSAPGFGSTNNVFTSSQMTKEQVMKQALTDHVRNFTGLEMSDMQLVNGRFYTPEGKDLIELLSESTKNGDRAEQASLDMSFMKRELNSLAQRGGYNSVPSLQLSIGWQNNSIINLHQGGTIDYKI
jgi:hypothetical protein